MTKHLSPDIRVPIDPDNPSIERHEDLCIRCGKCRDVCRDEISVHAQQRSLRSAAKK